MANTDDKVYTYVRQDWVNRFFGYLGTYHYLKSSSQVQTYEERLEVIQKSAEGKGNDYFQSENIVYIYGGPRSGKSEYLNLLKNAFEHKNLEDTHGCIQLELSSKDNDIKNASVLREMIKAKFETELEFRFPCTNIVDYLPEEKDNLKNFICGALNTANSIATGDYGGALNSIIASAKKVCKNWKDTKSIDKEIKIFFDSIIDELRDDKDGNIDFTALADNPYIWLELDLMANCKNSKKSTIVCMIDDFHYWDDYFDSKKGEKTQFLRFISVMFDIVWVLVSENKPSKLISKYMYKENAWRMSGLNEEITLAFFEDMCSRETDERYTEVYKRTHGYIGLVKLCVDEEIKGVEKPEKYTTSSAWCDKQTKEDNDNNSTSEFSLSTWVDYIFHGTQANRRKKKKVADRTEPIDFLVRDEINLNSEAEQKDKKYIIPTICYLIQLTLDSNGELGTVRQFSWNKKDNWRNLEKIGQECIEWIQNNSPFCIEYADFPDSVYLDPVIVELISEHNKYKKWLSEFESNCIKRKEDNQNNTHEDVEVTKDRNSQTEKKLETREEGYNVETEATTSSLLNSITSEELKKFLMLAEYLENNRLENAKPETGSAPEISKNNQEEKTKVEEKSTPDSEHNEREQAEVEARNVTDSEYAQGESNKDSTKSDAETVVSDVNYNTVELTASEEKGQLQKEEGRVCNTINVALPENKMDHKDTVGNNPKK